LRQEEILKKKRRILTKIPQYTRNSRHLQAVWKHGNPTKLFNLLKVERDRKFRRVKVSGRPYLLIVDPCNYCNLRCPLCPTGSQALNRKQRMLSFDEFKKIFDWFSRYLFEVSLHNWGEPLLNPDIYRMIEYAQRRNVGTNLSTNLVLMKPSDIGKILASGLEYLIVSLDATTPDVYDRYRVRGDFHRVMENMQLLIQKRNENRRKTPLVEWQFIVMSINQHQMEEAEFLSRKIGVDTMRFIPVGFAHDASDKKKLAEQWLPKVLQDRTRTMDGDEVEFDRKARPGPCFYLYRSVVVNPDGGLSPCCFVYDQKYDFGRIWDHPIDEIWNNAHYVSARSLFSGKQVKNAEAVPSCVKCDFFRRRPVRKP